MGKDMVRRLRFGPREGVYDRRTRNTMCVNLYLVPVRWYAMSAYVTCQIMSAM